ncbi:hypothetical protein HU200_008032 [Digitaria exilis]|uniref:Cyclin-dependent kinase inhibitor n=1 Tax=Digitaria exilis TaxID=1010633 RepID=A0A835KP98_9POAL|nr:hypothetical protein HU200_008032 [Digitaria exilis]
MGKCVRIRSSSNHPSPSPSSAGEAAAYLTLRSGRRVPVATCSSPAGRRHHRHGSSSSACRRCGAKGRTCGGSPGRRKSVGPTPAVLGGGGGGPEEEDKPPSSTASPVDGRKDSTEPNTPLAGGDAVRANNHVQSRKSGDVAGKQSPSPLVEAEMEAFFAAAELAERRRFAAA